MACPGRKVTTYLLMIALVLTVIPLPPMEPSMSGAEEVIYTRSTIIVNASGGGDYTHIQWAIDNASEGDKIFVEAGTYYENIVINKSITLSGESIGATTIMGEGRIITIFSNYVNVTGFNVTGSLIPFEGIGIYLENVNHCNISWNNCSNNSYCGIALRNVSNTVVSNNICDSEGTGDDYYGYTTGIGIFLNESTSNQITQNTCSNNTWSGIVFNNTNNSLISENICIDNGGWPTKVNVPTHEEEFGTGIYLVYSNNNSILSNYCNRSYSKGALSGICSGVALFFSNDNEVKNNNLMYSSNHGVYLYESSRCRIQDNNCIGGFLGAINIWEGKYNVIFRNRIAKYGMIMSSSYNVISHNSFKNYVLFIIRTSSYNSIIGNTFRDSNCGGIHFEDDSDNLDNTKFNRIHHNNLFNNSGSGWKQAADYGQMNSWNDSFGEGNYWSDYSSRYPSAHQNGSIWNQPYGLDSDYGAKDYFPLVNPIGEEMYYPVAMIGPPIAIAQHETFHFSGSHSFDCLGIVNYTWDLNYNGKHIRLFGISPKFTFHEAGVHKISLTVTNTQGNRDTATSIITVWDVDPPVAVIKFDESLGTWDNGVFRCPQHANFSFDGRNSTDNVGIMTYEWEIIKIDVYPVVAMGTGNGFEISFTFDNIGKYLVMLEVWDNEFNSGEQTISIDVIDSDLPIADAGPDIRLDQHQVAYLNASNCSGNVAITNYTWVFTYDGLDVFLYGKTAEFVFDESGNYPITLNISDAQGNWATDTLNVTVRDITPPIANAGPDIIINQSETVFFLNLIQNLTNDVWLWNLTWTFNYNGTEIIIFTWRSSVPHFRFDIPGIYVVIMDFSDKAGNWANDTLNITVLELSPQIEPEIDSDNDTYNDTFELSQGSNPNNPLSTPFDRDGDGYPNDEDPYPDDPERWGIDHWENWTGPDDGDRGKEDDGDAWYNLWWIVVILCVMLMFVVIGVVVFGRKRSGIDEEEIENGAMDDLGRVGKDGDGDSDGAGE